MRLLVASQFFPPEPVPIPGDVAAAAQAAGHQVRVLTGVPSYPAGRVLEGWANRRRADGSEAGMPVRRVGAYPSHDRSAVRRAASYGSFAASTLLSGRDLARTADVAYVYWPPPTAAALPLLARLRHGVPYVLHVQDLWPDSVLHSGFLPGGPVAAGAGRVVDAWCRLLYRHAAAVVCLSPGMATVLAGRGVPEDRLHVVWNWATEQPAPDRADRLAARRSLGLPDDAFVVMFAGNLGEYQALDVAVRAAARCADQGVHLALVGSGLAAESLRRLADELGARNVVLPGRRPAHEMPFVAAAADVQLVSLRPHGFFAGTVPGKLPAVLSSGQPVVCAVPGDAAALVAEARAGWPVPAGDETALVEALRQAAAASPDELAAAGRRGQNFYREHLARERGLPAVLDVLVRAAG